MSPLSPLRLKVGGGGNVPPWSYDGAAHDKVAVITSNHTNSEKQHSDVPYLSRADSLRDTEDAGGIGHVNDGNRIVLNVGQLLYVLRHLAGPPLLQPLQTQIKTLFTRTNVLRRRFKRCSLAVEVRLFRTFCVCFYDAALWTDFTIGAFNRLASC